MHGETIKVKKKNINNLFTLCF